MSLPAGAARPYRRGVRPRPPTVASPARAARRPRAVALAAALAAAALARAPRAAADGCPHATSDEVCRPWTALLLPTAFGAVFAPRDLGGTWVGGGLEVALLTWSDSSHALGPSHGKLRFDIGALGGSAAGAGTMAMYRGGAQLSIERNAARRWLIPYVAVDVGGLWTDATHGRGFVDGGLGVYLWHQRTVIVDVETTYLLPFSHPADVSGFRTQLALSVALW